MNRPAVKSSRYNVALIFLTGHCDLVDLSICEQSLIAPLFRLLTKKGTIASIKKQRMHLAECN